MPWGKLTEPVCLAAYWKPHLRQIFFKLQIQPFLILAQVRAIYKFFQRLILNPFPGICLFSHQNRIIQHSIQFCGIPVSRCILSDWFLSSDCVWQEYRRGRCCSSGQISGRPAPVGQWSASSQTDVPHSQNTGQTTGLSE